MLKFLDFGKIKPFSETIGRQRNLAWPVNVYRITMPKPAKNKNILNHFEQIIIKLLELNGPHDSDVLSKETCLPIDLVKCILLRLQDKTYIDEYNEIIRHNYDKLQGKESTQEFITVLLFKERACGKILPFLHFLDSEMNMKKKELKRYKEIYGRNDNEAPEYRDVIRLLKIMTKRSKSYNFSQYLFSKEKIIIFKEPEQYYLDCPIAIQKSDGEFRITDPFGFGFSRHLESAFSFLLEKDEKLKTWLMEWKENLKNPKAVDKIDRPKELFDTEENINRYEYLIEHMRLEKNAQYRSIIQIYASIELAFFYSCYQRSYFDVIKQLEIEDQADHQNIIESAAKQIGLDTVEQAFKPVSKGKLDDFKNGKPEMNTVLCISLLIAMKDKMHPLHNIAKHYPDLITKIFDIKNKRDKQEHGRSKLIKVKAELPEESFMQEIIQLLLPDIHFENTTTSINIEDMDSDATFHARSSIQNELEFKNYNQLGPNIQENLVAAERRFLSFADDEDAIHFINNLYAVLQAMFRKKIFYKIAPDIKDNELIPHAQKKALDSKLGSLPDTLNQVKKQYIRYALQNDDRSLGASIIAFLLMSDIDDLVSIYEQQASFLSDVSKIIDLRGHGNVSIKMLKTEIMKLRKAAYSTIKTLLEV